MGDMKDKMKDFMKKVNNPFSSSGKFKGPARTLGGSSSSGPTDRVLPRVSQSANSKVISNPLPVSLSNSSPPPHENTQKERPTSNLLDEKKIPSDPNHHRPPPDGFDPFDALITSGKRSKNGYSLNVFQCPVCKRAFGSEEEVSVHVESCLENSSETDVVRGDDFGSAVGRVDGDEKTGDELEVCVSKYLSGKPTQASVDVVLRLLGNVVKDPENSKFRKIRLSNPKIKESVTDVPGCIEVLELIGFNLQEEDGEMWSVMDAPSQENLCMLKKVILLLEPKKLNASSSSTKVDEHAASNAVKDGSSIEPKVVDRQIRVFFSVPESVASKIDLPESFYKLSVDELRRESEQRKKKIADSQLLIPKSYKEKQIKMARSKYTKTIIRVQFPDGVVLQALFSPREPTSVLYECVRSSLKQPGLEFELLHPIPVKRRVIPCFAGSGCEVPTMDEEDLVPAALVKFRPIETDSMVFIGLRDDLLQISEPLTNSHSSSSAAR